VLGRRVGYSAGSYRKCLLFQGLVASETVNSFSSTKTPGYSSPSPEEGDSELQRLRPPSPCVPHEGRPLVPGAVQLAWHGWTRSYSRAMPSDPMSDRLTQWAGSSQAVRAAVLTSTRAIPGGHLDAYSDYDVVLVVDSVPPLVEDTSWLGDFGDVLVAYWDPIHTDPSSGAERAGSVVHYVDGLKIDFSLWSRQAFADATAGPEPHPEFDAGHRVLLDKDQITAGLPAPTFAAYIPTPPDEATYLRLITDFLTGVPYVAKSLLRGELLPAKWVLDFDMRFNYLLPMLEWSIECEHGWTLQTGSLGKGLQPHLPAAVWHELEQTFAGADSERNWDALFTMTALFARTSRQVAEHLGHSYPGQLINNVTTHAHRMRAGDFAHGPIGR
jgi:aminoglycoside 6-adenylyltransferase